MTYNVREPDQPKTMIEVAGLVKSYGNTRALNGLDFTVPEGSVLGLLGPNGAGKTTVVSILTTLIPADGGRASVAGVDVRQHPARVRSLIGLSGQYAAVDEHLTGFENLELIGRLYHLGNRRARSRATELLDTFNLAEAGHRPVGTYSGGMRRRLDLAGALVAEPPVLFMDEPTTGLDPRSRNELWQVIRSLVGKGTTLLLTTQYMEEAEQLADDIVVVDHGRKIAHGTTDQLKRRIGGERIEIAVASDNDLEKTRKILATIAHGELHIESTKISAPVMDGPGSLSHALGLLNEVGVKMTDVGLRRPTLDEVFLSITGHAADELREAS